MAKIIKNFCKVLIGGKDVATKPGIVSVMIKRALNRIPLAEVILYDGPALKKNFPLSQESDFTPGKSTVTIKMGKSEPEMVTVFSGIIISQTLKAPLDSPATIKLELRDPMIASTVIRKNRYFKDSDDSNIFFKIVSDYPDVLFDDFDGGATHKEMVQYNSTDWDFILLRAEANGFFVYFNQPKEGPAKIKIGPPVFSPGSETIKYGKDIVEIEANISARDQYASVNSKYWKYTDQKAKSENSSGNKGDVQGSVKSTTLADVLGGKPYLQQTFGNLEDRELKDWSNAKAMRSKLSKVQGRVRIYGNIKINPGDMIKLEGVGTTYGPDAFVSEVMHSMSASSTWYTDIKFGYDDEWFYERHQNIMDKSAAGLIPGIQGLCCGTVKDIVDPDGQYRVKVNIPFVNVDPTSGEANADGVWARMVSADAGGGKRGFLIRPEVDDEVIVGFLNNDPRDPVILGTVYSSSKNKVPSLLEIKKTNVNKGWITLGETQFLIDDTDGKQKVTVKTKKENSIVIDDDKESITITDKHKNIIEMKKDLIKITAKKDFKLEAGGKVDIKAKDNVTISSDKKVTAKGTQGTEVSASGGNTVIKGTQVQIN